MRLESLAAATTEVGCCGGAREETKDEAEEAETEGEAEVDGEARRDEEAGVAEELEVRAIRASTPTAAAGEERLPPTESTSIQAERGTTEKGNTLVAEAAG